MTNISNYIVGKNKDQYCIGNELNSGFLLQMIKFAHTDQQIIDHTSDSQRFSSLESAQKWLKKASKYFFTLSPIKNQNNLAGIIWFENLELPKILKDKYSTSDWTFGIRIYQSHRGNGLAFPFMQTAFKKFLQQFPHQPVWLSTQLSNQTATNLYQKFGFKKIGEVNNKAYFLYELDNR